MNNLKLLRTRANMKQTDLAKKLGIAQSTLSGWETGKFEIDNANLNKLALLFDVSIDYLLGRTGYVCVTDYEIQVMEYIHSAYPARFREINDRFSPMNVSETLRYLSEEGCVSIDRRYCLTQKGLDTVSAYRKEHPAKVDYGFDNREEAHTNERFVDINVPPKTLWDRIKAFIYGPPVTVRWSIRPDKAWSVTLDRIEIYDYIFSGTTKGTTSEPVQGVSRVSLPYHAWCELQKSEEWSNLVARLEEISQKHNLPLRRRVLDEPNAADM